MKISRLHAIAAAVTIVSAAGLAHVAVPRELMAASMAGFDLQTVVPKEFGEWTYDPRIRLIEPPAADSLARQLYSQEMGRGYRNREGHLVMLLVAYGPNQSDRLQLHRPEICYAAEGFRVSRPTSADISYRDGAAPLRVTRLTAQREARLEPVSYWMRVGNDVATGIIERQVIKLKYGLRGIIPDGALIRVSTTGLPVEAAYQMQDRFIRELLAEIVPENRRLLVGDGSGSLIRGLAKTLQ